MAKLNHPLFKGLSGSIGNLVFRQVNGETIVSLRPEKSAHIASARQLQHRKIFAEATAWAKAIVKHPEKRAAYAYCAAEGEKLNDVLKRMKVAELRIAAGLPPRAGKRKRR